MLVDDCHSLTDSVLGYIPDHEILRQTQWAVIGRAYSLEYWAGRIGIFEEVIRNRMARFDHAHDFAECLRCRMDLCANLQRSLRREPIFFNEIGNSDKAFMNDEVGVFSILDKPLVGKCIAPVDDLQAIPLKRITD